MNTYHTEALNYWTASHKILCDVRRNTVDADTVYAAHEVQGIALNTERQALRRACMRFLSRQGLENDVGPDLAAALRV